MSILAQLVIAIGIFLGGLAAGIKWHAGQDAIAAEQARDLRDSDARQARRFADIKAGQHTTQVATLSNQLGAAREQIATLSGRPCLDPGAVGMLNATGVFDGGAAAGEPASAAPAAAASASDRDVAGYIALCRTRYAEVADQLNQILDIEDRRNPR